MDLKDKINDLLRLVDTLHITHNAARDKVFVLAELKNRKWQQSGPPDELESVVTRVRESVLYDFSEFYRKEYK